MEISQMCRILRPGRSAHFLSSSHTSSSWPSPSPEHGFSHWFLKQTQSSALSPEAPNRRVHDHVRISEREAVQRWEQRTMRAAILESCLAHALLSAPTQHSGNCLYLLGGVWGGRKPLASNGYLVELAHKMQLWEWSIISCGFISIQLFLFPVHSGQFVKLAVQTKIQVRVETVSLSWDRRLAPQSDTKETGCLIS